MAEVWDAELGGSKEHVLHEDVDVLMGSGNFWASGQLKSILGVGQGCAVQKTGEPILTIYIYYVLLWKELAFGGCTCIKIFSGINFLPRDAMLARY